MSHDPFETLLRKSGPTEHLSPEDRAAMRSALVRYLEYRPMRVPIARTQAWTEALRALVQHGAPAFLSTFLIIAVATGSVASAAERALPGDTLYPVKVRMLEPLRLSLVSSDETRLVWERTFAERRLTEAAQLAEQDRLSPGAEAELVATFEHYANLALQTPESAPQPSEADAGLTMTMSARVSTPSPDPEVEDFSARLAAYEAILSHIDRARGKKTTETLRSAIRAQTTKVPETDDTPLAVDDAMIAELRLAADEALSDSTSLVATLKASATATTSSSAESELQRAAALRALGERLLAEEKPEEATRALKKSLKAAARLNVFAEAAATLETDPFVGLTDTATSTATTTEPTTGAPAPLEPEAPTPEPPQNEAPDETSSAASADADPEASRSLFKFKLGF